MTSQVFVKFQYQDKIKKVSIPPEEFIWKHVCKILWDSFLLAEDNIRLSYKDSDGDVITVSCDDDLREAYKLTPPKTIQKFFVTKIDRKSLEKGRPSKRHEYFKLKSFADQENPISQALIMKKDYSEGQVLLKKKSEELPLKLEEPIEEKRITVGCEDIEVILNNLFQTKDAKQEIKLLKNRLGISGSVGQEDSSKVDFNIQDQRLSDFLTAAFKKLLFEPVPEDDQKVEGKQEAKSSDDSKKAFVEEEKAEPHKNLLNVSLKESMYGDGGYTPLGQTKVDDFKMKSQNGSISFCKDLSATHGVKLAVKYENGKMKLMSIPIHEYSIIESAEELNKFKF